MVNVVKRGWRAPPPPPPPAWANFTLMMECTVPVRQKAVVTNLWCTRPPRPRKLERRKLKSSLFDKARARRSKNWIAPAAPGAHDSQLHRDKTVWETRERKYRNKCRCYPFTFATVGGRESLWPVLRIRIRIDCGRLHPDPYPGGQNDPQK